MKTLLYICTIFLTLGLLASCSSDVNVDTSNELPEANISPEDLAALRANYDTDGDGLFDHLDPCPDTPLNDQDGDGVCEVILSDINEDGCVNLQDQGILGTELRQSGEDLLADLLPDGVVNLLDVAVFGMENGQCQDNCPTVFNPDQNADACTGALTISGIEFDESSLNRYSNGTDIWPMTWHSDGHLYISGGDGDGFDGTDTRGLDISRLTGGPSDPIVENSNAFELFSAVDMLPKGMLSIGDNLYVLAQERENGYNRAVIGKSTDDGSTWTWKDDSSSPPTTGSADSNWHILTPAFAKGSIINYGQAYAGARDEYVYITGFENGGLVLSRVLKADIQDFNAYEFFDGTSENPSWSSAVGDRTPIFSRPGEMHWGTAINYNPVLKRYLLCFFTDNFGTLAVYDGPEPWGPWTKIHEAQLVDSEEKFHMNFVNKDGWLSSDGKTWWFVVSGLNEWDSFNVLKATLSTTPESDT